MRIIDAFLKSTYVISFLNRSSMSNTIETIPITMLQIAMTYILFVTFREMFVNKWLYSCLKFILDKDETKTVDSKLFVIR